ncbi:MAG: phosphoribosylaminoimidazole carboxylase ade2 [Trizodia sp. TS-e1964]|nr:MAG: phosphoribosylaminoimidazole carboxylase ade2 [Trizodia sp. TS-e1964]
MEDRVLGILGGGQLGRMLTEAANRLNIAVAVLDSENAPAKQINPSALHITGSFNDPVAIRKLASNVDIITAEIEHVDTYVLEEIAENGFLMEDGSYKKVTVQPHWRTLRIIQDKYTQKTHLQSKGIPVAESISLGTATFAMLTQVGEKLGYPFMLKSKLLAYDGRGNFPVRSPSEISKALQCLGSQSLYAEKWADFKCELAVMVVKTDEASLPDGKSIHSTIAYPVVESVQEDSICKLVYAPARNLSPEIAKEASLLARKAVASFEGTGIFGVELFLLHDNTLLLNEIAPRPHNTGHYTIEACQISQFEAHIYAILGYTITRPDTPNIRLLNPAIMLNILGGAQPDSHYTVARKARDTLYAHLHMYGKGSGRPGRKMGHVTVIEGGIADAERAVAPLIQAVDGIRAECQRPPDYQNATVDKPSAPIPIPPRSIPPPYQVPRIAVTMGSVSDLPVLRPGLALLKSLQIPFTVTVTSAHRTPARMTAFAQDAAASGIKVIIAAAGGAAHLPGMIAANTPLPVIGVPVRGSSLDGMDSLMSIVQMPVSPFCYREYREFRANGGQRGVPVATVAINNSVNAALLALRILGVGDEEVARVVRQYAERQEHSVMSDVRELETVGWEAFEAKSS